MLSRTRTRVYIQRLRKAEDGFLHPAKKVASDPLHFAAACAIYFLRRRKGPALTTTNGETTLTYYEQTIGVLNAYRDRLHGGNSEAAARGLGVPGSTFWRWTHGKCSPDLDAVSKAWAAIGGGDIMDAAPEAPEALQAPDAVIQVLPMEGSENEHDGSCPVPRSLLDAAGVRDENARWIRIPAHGAPAGTKPEDVLIVDTLLKDPTDGGLCVADYDGTITVRVATAVPGGWALGTAHGGPSCGLVGTDGVNLVARAVFLLRDL